MANLNKKILGCIVTGSLIGGPSALGDENKCDNSIKNSIASSHISKTGNIDPDTKTNYTTLASSCGEYKFYLWNHYDLENSKRIETDIGVNYSIPTIERTKIKIGFERWNLPDFRTLDVGTLSLNYNGYLNSNLNASFDITRGSQLYDIEISKSFQLDDKLYLNLSGGITYSDNGLIGKDGWSNYSINIELNKEFSSNLSGNLKGKYQKGFNDKLSKGGIETSLTYSF